MSITCSSKKWNSTYTLPGCCCLAAEWVLEMGADLGWPSDISIVGRAARVEILYVPRRTNGCLKTKTIYSTSSTRLNLIFRFPQYFFKRETWPKSCRLHRVLQQPVRVLLIYLTDNCVIVPMICSFSVPSNIYCVFIFARFRSQLRMRRKFFVKQPMKGSLDWFQWSEVPVPAVPYVITDLSDFSWMQKNRSY